MFNPTYAFFMNRLSALAGIPKREIYGTELDELEKDSSLSFFLVMDCVIESLEKVTCGNGDYWLKFKIDGGCDLEIAEKIARFIANKTGQRVVYGGHEEVIIEPVL